MDKKITKDTSKRTLTTIIYRNGVKTEKHRGPTKDMIKRTLKVSRRVWLAKGYSDVTQTVYVSNYDKESNPWHFPATGLYKSFDEIMNQLQGAIDKAFPQVAFPYRVLSDEITLYQRNPEDIDYSRELAIIKIGDDFCSSNTLVKKDDKKNLKKTQSTKKPKIKTAENKVAVYRCKHWELYDDDPAGGGESWSWCHNPARRDSRECECGRIYAQRFCPYYKKGELAGKWVISDADRQAAEKFEKRFEKHD